MILGTHVHHTKPSKFSYSAKPDFLYGVCRRHFKNGRSATIILSQKIRGVEQSLSTLYYRFSGAQISEKVLPNTSSHCIRHFGGHFKQYGGHFQNNTSRGSISETKRCKAFNFDCLGFVGHRRQKKYVSELGINQGASVADWVRALAWGGVRMVPGRVRISLRKTSLRNFGNSVYPAFPVSFGGDTKNRPFYLVSMPGEVTTSLHCIELSWTPPLLKSVSMQRKTLPCTRYGR